MSRRILVLNTDLDRGGAPHIVREVATRLVAPDVHVEVACLAGRGPVAGEIEAAGVTVTALGASGPTDWRIISALSRLIRTRGFDTVLSYLVHANAAAAMTAVFNRRVRYFQDLQNAQSRPVWHWWVETVIQGFATRIIVPSESVADCTRRRSLVRRGRIAIVPNGVDVARFESVASAPVVGEFRLGFIGRLDPIKHVPDAIAAMTGVQAAVRLHVFGDGPDRSRIEQAIARDGVTERVVLHGMVPCPEQALAHMDALILPSESEGFGMVLVEAMAAGIPIIATDAPGIRDVVQHQHTALLSPVGDSCALAASINRLASDSDLRSRLISEGRRVVRDRFTWDRVMAQYRQVLGL